MTETTKQISYAVYLSEEESKRFLQLKEHISEQLNIKLGYSEMLKLLINNRIKELGIK